MIDLYEIYHMHLLWGYENTPLCEIDSDPKDGGGTKIFEIIKTKIIESYLP